MDTRHKALLLGTASFAFVFLGLILAAGVVLSAVPVETRLRLISRSWASLATWQQGGIAILAGVAGAIVRQRVLLHATAHSDAPPSAGAA